MNKVIAITLAYLLFMCGPVFAQNTDYKTRFNPFTLKQDFVVGDNPNFTNLTVDGTVSASEFYGDGSNLTGIVADFGGNTTDDLAEGTSNLYWQEAPVDGTPYARQDEDWVSVSGTSGTEDHSELTNLNWADSGHTIDTDVDFGGNKIIMSPVSEPSAPATDSVYIYTKDDDGIARLYYKANDGEIAIGDTSNSVLLTGNQSIDGVKTFTSFPEISSGDPTTAHQFVTKSYADSIAAGLIVKEAVRVATTEDITLENLQTIDGVTLQAGDRVLVKDQTDGSENGIYLAVDSGSWTRATDYDSDAEVVAGTFPSTVLEGTININKQFAQVSDMPELGTDPLVFSQLNAQIIYDADNGIYLDTTTYKLGGGLIEDTTITTGTRQLNLNNNSSGDINFQDNGTTRMQFDDGGLVGIGRNTLADTQVVIQPSVGTVKGLTVRGASDQSDYLMLFEDSAGTDLSNIDKQGNYYNVQTVDQTTPHAVYAQQIPATLKSYTNGTNDLTKSGKYLAFKLDLSGEADTLNIRSIGLQPKLSALPTNLTAYDRLYLYSDNGGEPGTSLAAGSYYRYGRMSTSYTTRQFNLTYAAVPAVYWIVLNWSAAPTGETLTYRGNSAITGESFSSSDGTTWSAEDGRPRYYIYGRTGYAGYFRSDSNIGVYGYSYNTYGGQFISENGTALYGSSPQGYGVYGVSTYSNGVYGSSTYGDAISGATTSGDGVQGTAVSGVGVRGTTTTGTGVYATSTSGTALYGSTDTGSGIYVNCNNATGNGLQELVRLRRMTSGTPSNGLGSYIDWELEDSAGAGDVWSRWIVKADDVTNTSEDARIEIQTRNAGSLATRMTIADGNVGIADTTPEEKLTVVGNVKATAFIGDGTDITSVVHSESDPVFSAMDTLEELDTQIGTSGTPSSTTYLRGDNTWATPEGGSGGDAFLPINLSSDLSVTQDMSISGDVTANAFFGDGSNLTGITTDPTYWESDGGLLYVKEANRSDALLLNAFSGVASEGESTPLFILTNTDDGAGNAAYFNYIPDLNILSIGAVDLEFAPKSTEVSFSYSDVGIKGGDLEVDGAGDTGTITLKDLTETGSTSLSFTSRENLTNFTTTSDGYAFDESVWSKKSIGAGHIYSVLGNSQTDLTDEYMLDAARSSDTDGDYLYVGCYGDTTYSPFRIYDIRDEKASSPELVSPLTISGTNISTHGIKAVRYRDDHAYVTYDSTGDEAFRIINVSDRTNPVVKGGAGLTELENMGGGATLDIDLSDTDVIYLVGQTMVYSVDVSDEDTPVILDSVHAWEAPGTMWSAKWANGYLFVTGRGATTNTINVIDTSNPSSLNLLTPSTVLDINEGAWTLCAESDGNTIYVAAGGSFTTNDDDKFLIVDTTDKYNLTVSGSLKLSSAASSYVKKSSICDDIVYLCNWGDSTEDNVFAINVADKENPFIIQSDYYADMPVNLLPFGRYLYVLYAPFIREGTFIGVVDSGNSIIGYHANICEVNAENVYATGDLTADGSLTASSIFLADGTQVTAGTNVDWTLASQGTIHATNYVDNNTTYTAGVGLQLDGTVFSVSDTLTANGETAYGWGDHAAAGYLTESTATATYVPYSGATSDVELGSNALLSSELTVNTAVYTPSLQTTGTGDLTLESDSGTVDINGNVSISCNAQAVAFFGDGSNLTGISTASNWVDIDADVSTSGNATVEGALFVGGEGTYSIEGTNGNVTIDDDLYVSGDWTLGTTLSQSGGNAYYKGVEIGTDSGGESTNWEDVGDDVSLDGSATVTGIVYTDTITGSSSTTTLQGNCVLDSTLTSTSGTWYYNGEELGTGTGGGETGDTIWESTDNVVALNTTESGNLVYLDGGLDIDGDATISHSVSTSVVIEEVTIDISALLPGLELRAQYLNGSGYSSMPGIIPAPGSVALSDGLIMIDESDRDYIEIAGMEKDFSSHVGITLDFASDSAQFSAAVCPDATDYGDEVYHDLGAEGLEWNNAYLQGELTASGVNTASVSGSGAFTQIEDDLQLDGTLSISDNMTSSGAGTGATTYIDIIINGVKYKIEAVRE